MSESSTERERGGRRRTGTANQEGIMWTSGIASLVGAWIAVSALVLGGMGDASVTNNLAVGIVVFLVAGYNFYRLYTDHPSSTAAMGLVLLLGVWMLVFPFAVETTGAAFWSDVASGVVVLLIGLYGAYTGRSGAERAAEQVR